MDNNFYSRRLKALYKAFANVEIDIAGLIQKPLIVLDEYKLLNIKLDGPLIHFLDQDAKPVHTFNISGLELEQEFIESYIEAYGFTPVYRLKHEHAPLFVAGFDYKIKEGSVSKEHKYPVFGRHKLRYFFNEEDAKATIEEFPDYELVVD